MKRLTSRKGRRVCIWAALSSALSAACSEDRLKETVPVIAVCRPGTEACGSPLSLSAFRAGVEHAASVEIRNVGLGTLAITAVTLVSGDAVVLDGEAPTRAPRGEPAIQALRLTPLLGANSAVLAVDSDDPATPRYHVEVTFDGVAPGLVLCPSSPPSEDPCSAELTVDLREVRLTRSRDATVLVRNAGTEALQIEGARLEGETSEPGEVELLTSTAGGLLAAGQDSPIVLRYRPADAIPDAIDVVVLSGDAMVPNAVLHLKGTAPANDPPIADAVELDTGAVVLDGEVRRSSWLDGRGSRDPEGDPLLYAWSVVARPFGSTAQVESPAAQLTRFIPDVAGTYLLQLQVEDSLGLVGFDDITVEAAAGQQLRVDLTWGTNAGDVDLHVLPQGADLFGASDCFFGQTTVDLGVAGDPNDDAVLFSDVEAASGGERVAIRRPAAGAYDVWAHYFDSRGGRLATLVVRVSRDDGTVILGEVNGSLTTDCETWRVGTITWPGGAFSSANDAHGNVCYGGTP